MKLAVLIAIAVTAAFLGVVYIVGYSAPSPEHEQRNTNEQTATYKKHDSSVIEMLRSGFYSLGRYVHKYREDVVAVGTFFIAVFTIILAFATGFLYVATRNLVEEGKNSSEKQLRAYIGPHSMDFTVYPFEKGDYAFIAHIEMRNFGQTPAYKMKVWSAAKIDVDGANPFDMSKESQGAAYSISFPGSSFHVNQGWQISSADKEDIYNRKKFLFLWGVVRYTDAFNHNRHFTFKTRSTGELVVGSGGIYKMAAIEYDAD